MKLTANSLKVMRRRALRKNGKESETPREAFLRVARVVASAERFYGIHESQLDKIERQFFEIQSNLDFLSGKPLIQAGRPDKCLSACFVLPIKDSMHSIFGTLRDNIKILQMGGGTGFNFSRIRSRDELVGSSGEPAAGPVYFLKVYSQANKVVRDRGGRQMGAMAILNVNHPDIESFINLKVDDQSITNFNISVGVTDEFMQKASTNAHWNMIEPHTKMVKKRVSAKRLFNQISELAWRTGDPGMLFLDATERANVTPRIGKLDGTNPCGEQPLLPYESCNLGSIAVNRFVNKRVIDYARLEKVIRVAVRFLDDVIDVNNYPLNRIEQMSKANRKMGLGIMGFADLLVELEVPYASDEAVKVACKLMKYITDIGRDESVQLAKEKGSFPSFVVSTWPKQGFKQLRNAGITTIAPTGTISVIAGCSPGIEPLFALGFVQKNVMRAGDELVQINKLFEQVAKRKGFYSKKLIKEVARTGSVQECKDVPERYRRVFKTAHEIDAKWHVKIQAAFQKYTDNAVSKTVNLPTTATADDVKNIYRLAWELGCKGVTVYRDGCKHEQVMNIGVKN
ncbi:adenosylcobalamin-dependent ribonucleoside-diphosphate reductase [Patescibacteria group bacterium]|nr:adenosylcobalamin-dependent ribonucleoside-diphosphate reductase [Patescibacteria group bacterium]MBU1868236.1 adenosylcobalamin-dependent ribonucleoside-diphosphate reductase [Patescibacteria group bacterium]